MDMGTVMKNTSHLKYVRSSVYLFVFVKVLEFYNT